MIGEGAARTTRIRCVYINTVSQSGIVQFGDRSGSEQRSQAIAVQRAVVTERTGEFRFDSYPLFILPKLEIPACDLVAFHTSSGPHPLRIGTVCLTGVSAASLFRAGCGGAIVGTSRIKHIRQYNYRDIR